MKLRTIAKAYEYLKEIDPNPDITPYLIRKLSQTEQISFTQTGNKVLIDVDSLLDFLSGKEFTPRIIKLN